MYNYNCELFLSLQETLSSQLPVFEQFLDTAPKSGGYDAVRQCVVLLVGSLARHLAPNDARVRPITLRLIAALSTPSQQVQEAVSNCLPHLVTSPALEKEIPTIVNKLLKQLLTAEKYGDRKGAAYGIAGIIKGLGILSLKQLDVMGKLTEAIQEKKNFKYREGALFGFEMLCCKLGRLFEPYIVHVLPHLLLCFGDSSQYVRAAADDTAKLIMSRLSAHGVKLVLPSLLQALQDDNWRTKAGSIELLGAMAYCAPKQLSSCLPSIVPKLIEVLSDSHMRVQEAGAEALKVIGSVIRNPEIQAIVPVLLHALQDPSNKTSLCLQTLLDTKFVHFIDAPSLALIMPVVERAFLDRSTETRKMAAQIIGNMYSLTDQKDLMPYLPSIIPGLKSSLLDPVPEVRSVSARALGAMVRGMGEGSFEELLPWLMHTLTSESSSVDRSGAAQGLSEVVAGLGSHKLHKIMPDIIATAERTDIAPHVKDGYIMMFIYMPGAFTDEFLPYIGQIINPILKALADENEYVRETALKAGQRIVNLYAESAIQLLLPELENGLFDDNWRIRYSSVQLLGDLLYRISGVSGKMSTETASEDDNFGTEHSHKAIMNALGPERRNRVLAGLYMGRSDVALMVRQAALHVWKVVVTNTPKTLREILPTLFNLLLGCLASTSYDKRQVAARTLGDLVRKLGERVLPDIVPILERGLRSERADQRQGVCIGLGEILASTSRDAVLGFADGLVPTVRTALCDELPEVRMAAARAFDSLHATIGNKALDDILPPMLDGLRNPDPAVADATLDGLKQ
ncbi:jg21021, partial [Pararge aegeria aegeria]